MPGFSVGIVHADLTVFSPDGSRSGTFHLIADPGALWTWLPQDALARLGIEPTDTGKFRTIDGRDIDRRIADASVECVGRRGIRRIVFAELGDSTVLGADTMEGLGLEVDPVHRRVKPMDAVPAYAA